MFFSSFGIQMVHKMTRFLPYALNANQECIHVIAGSMAKKILECKQNRGDRQGHLAWMDALDTP